MTDLSRAELDLDELERNYSWKSHQEGNTITALVRELREARRELDETKRTVAAASRYMFGRDEAIARAERSEVELDQLRVVAAACVARESRQSPADDSLRAALAASEKRRAELAHEVEVSHSVVESKTKWGNALFLRAERAEAACAQMRAELMKHVHLTHPLLATDVGAGYVDPQTHAAVVNDCIRWKTMAGVLTKERNEARKFHSDEYRNRMEWQEEEQRLRAQLAECQAQLAEVRATLELLKSTPLGRVQLLEAVAEDARVLLANDDAGSDDWGDIADSLDALDAHDKQEGRHE